MNTPFILITGFLGSGKTTLLQRIVAQYAATKQLAIIQNEFAASGVDGTQLRLSGKPFELIEINKGSVFCVCLLSDFMNTLTALLDQNRFDAIILEATGLADPIALGQLISDRKLQGKTYLQQVFCVVDAATFLTMESKITRMTHQARVADVVLINKIDSAPEKRVAVRTRIAAINPAAKIVECLNATINLDDLFADAPILPIAKTIPDTLESAPRPPIGSAVLRHASPLAAKKLNSFIDALATQCWRLKGFVHLDNGTQVMIQSVLGNTTMQQVEPFNGPSELVCMGPDITQESVQRQFSAIVLN